MSSQDPRKAHQVALEHIETALLEHRWPVGAQLPPERQLAQQLGVSRGAVREAIRVLQAQGILESHPGPGRGTRITAGQTHALGRLFRLHVAIASTSVEDLTEARIALERSAAALAARHISQEELAEQEDLLEQMDQAGSVAGFNALDSDFHVAIALAARTPFIGDLCSAIREALREPLLRASEELEDWPRFRAALSAQHRRLHAAIAGGEAELAAGLAEEHIRFAWVALGLDRAP